MGSGSSFNDNRPPRSSIKRFSFEGSDDNLPSQPSHTDVYSPNRSLPDHSESDDDRDHTYHSSEFLTTSIGVPEFDPEVFQGDCLSQNLFDNDEYDVESNHSDERDDCEIVNIVQSNSQNDAGEVETGSSVEIVEHLNGSTVNPILVDDSVVDTPSRFTHTLNSTSNTLISNLTPSRFNTNSRNNFNTNQNTNSNSSNSNFSNSNNNSNNNYNNTNNNNGNNGSSSTNSNRRTVTTEDQENEDCIMGPVRFINKRPPQFPIDYYRPTKNISQSYTFLDHEYATGIEGLEDIEFLFKCPICYSTITRLRSGKVPNESDKVIYSTKCGHLFCYECIENVRRRKECSICRKKVNDRNQFHVIFP